ncbi:hypothetical protein SKAU_G00218320 [Synaphobranchus kaupii]|uniref:Uncharacterized protein n=1 Tax=Synaphobranchus kaupii TaxID=118154 RepID=A0A9Q1FAD4_SYNKA|nr:hypothetical protein SKAU_G00218320 [Synaphobranchus kaupii]
MSPFRSEPRPGVRPLAALVERGSLPKRRRGTAVRTLGVTGVRRPHGGAAGRDTFPPLVQRRFYRYSGVTEWQSQKSGSQNFDRAPMAAPGKAPDLVSVHCVQTESSAPPMEMTAALTLLSWQQWREQVIMPGEMASELKSCGTPTTYTDLRRECRFCSGRTDVCGVQAGIAVQRSQQIVCGLEHLAAAQKARSDPTVTEDTCHMTHTGPPRAQRSDGFCYTSKPHKQRCAPGETSDAPSIRPTSLPETIFKQRKRSISRGREEYKEAD